MVSAIFYAFLCFRFSTRKLLVFGIVLSVIGSGSIVLVHTYQSALVASLLIGLTNGIARAGIYDLLYRASPPGLEGVAVSLGIAATYLAGTVADVFNWVSP
jgi:predicted MFS family arabinose efflux permease